MLRSLAPALALALLASPAAAVPAQYTVTSLEFDGQTTLSGPLMAWFVDAPRGTRWTVTALNAHLDKWQGVSPRGAGDGVGLPVINADSSSHWDAVGEAEAWQESGRLVVVPVDDGALVTVRTDGARVEAFGRECADDPSQVREGPSGNPWKPNGRGRAEEGGPLGAVRDALGPGPWAPAERGPGDAGEEDALGSHGCFSTANGGLVRGRMPAEVTLEGSFLVKAFGWNGTLRSQQGSATFWSGSTDDAGGAGLGLGKVQQVEATFWHAVLRLEAVPALGELVMLGVHADTEGAVALDAPGSDALLLAGPTAMDLEFTHQTVLAGLPPGERPVLASELLALSGAVWIPLVAAVGAVGLGVGLALYFLLRNRDPILRALHAGQPARAAELAASAGPAASTEQALVRAVAFIQTGDYQRAERELAAYANPSADQRFVLACLRARQGRDLEARTLLAECVAMDQSYAGEVRHNPDLLRVTQGEPVREGYA